MRRKIHLYQESIYKELSKSRVVRSWTFLLLLILNVATINAKVTAMADSVVTDTAILGNGVQRVFCSTSFMDYYIYALEKKERMFKQYSSLQTLPLPPAEEYGWNESTIAEDTRKVRNFVLKGIPELSSERNKGSMLLLYYNKDGEIVHTQLYTTMPLSKDIPIKKVKKVLKGIKRFNLTKSAIDRRNRYNIYYIWFHQ